MDNTIIGVIIGSTVTLIGTVLTLIVNYFTSVKKQKEIKYRKFLVQAYTDIAAYHRLEELYSENISSLTDLTTTAVKRSYRRTLRIKGFPSPSRDSTIEVAEQRIKEFS